MKPCKVRLVCLVVQLLTNSAAIFKSSRSKIDLASHPSGTKVYVDGNYMGNTRSSCVWLPA
jgi:hypothetical protein